MRILHIAVIASGCVFGVAAQDRITVPLSNPSQPVTIKANLVSGSITVRAGTGHDVIVTSTDSGKSRRAEGAPPGMKRIGGGLALNVEEDHNVVTISPGPGGGGNLEIETPVNTNLQLKTVNGRSIEVTGVTGDLEIENTNGSLRLANVSGSVVAHTVNGEVTATLDRVSGNKPMSFTSLNGKVDVTLPADTKARLRLKSDHGSIYSDFDVKMEPDTAKQVTTEAGGQNAKYRISVERSVTGTINGGGPEFTFQTMNGNILLHKK